MRTNRLRTNQLSLEAYRWYLDYLAAMDRKDLDAYGAFLAAECSLQMNNQPATVGKEAVLRGLGAYWRSFASIEHDLDNIYGDDRRFALEALNHYRRLDGGEVTLRAVAFTDRDEAGLVASVRLHTDTGPLFAPGGRAPTERPEHAERPGMRSPDPRLRPYKPEDLPAMQQVRRDAFRPVFQSFRDIAGERVSSLAFSRADAEQARLLEDLCGPGSGHRVLVATVGDRVVGFVSFRMDEGTRTGEIGLNAVHPDHAGRGIGTGMYEHAMARMKECGMVLATVGTGGDPSHAPARRAYEKAGFGAALPSVTLYKPL